MPHFYIFLQHFYIFLQLQFQDRPRCYIRIGRPSDPRFLKDTWLPVGQNIKFFEWVCFTKIVNYLFKYVIFIPKCGSKFGGSIPNLGALHLILSISNGLSNSVRFVWSLKIFWKLISNGNSVLVTPSLWMIHDAFKFIESKYMILMLFLHIQSPLGKYGKQYQFLHNLVAFRKVVMYQMSINFNHLVCGDNRRSYILKQTCMFV